MVDMARRSYHYSGNNPSRLLLTLNIAASDESGDEFWDNQA
jgi:hypothetical protein